MAAVAAGDVVTRRVVHGAGALWRALAMRVEAQAAAHSEATAERLADRLADQYPDLSVTRRGTMVTLTGKGLRERQATDAGLRWPGR